MKTTFLKTATVSALLLAGLCPVRSESFSEPPLVIYGKVIQVGAGASYQLFSGELSLTLVSESNPALALTKKIQLGPVGENGAFSYRVEIPLKYLPGESELADNLSVGHEPARYQFESLTLDGAPAKLLDSTLTEVTVQFAKRAAELRLDLQTALASVDSDGDGIPDWWEDQHGLNRHYALDAAADPDGDGLSNLEEFLNGTDPNTANYTPLVKTTSIPVPIGGRAGLHLLIIDQDTDPSDTQLAYLNPTPGLTWRRNGLELGPGDPFTYADVVAGRISLEADSDFQGLFAAMSLEDRTGGGGITQFAVQIQALSPRELRPAVWLHAGTLDSNGPITEWVDASGNSRDGYQPAAAARPTSDAGNQATFAPGQFLYVDDRGLALEAFTAFLDFGISATGETPQTLFSTPDLQWRVGGDAEGARARSLQVIQSGRMIQGPVIEPGRSSGMTLASSPDQAFLIGPDQNSYASIPSAAAPLSTFTTIGGLQRLSDSGARDFLQGTVRELILFDRALPADERARLQDYQHARWDGWLLWDYHDETLPIRVQGSADADNLITGGWGADTLIGGPLDDILRGGPGADDLTGGAGADRFEILPDSGNDTLTDFSPDAGDVMDLTSLFGSRTGTPSHYVNIRAQVTRGADNVPVVNSLIELDYVGDGGTPDQVITLQGLSIGNSDLPRLVGEGTIRLGGPKFETSILLATPGTNLFRNNLPHAIQVSRSGNLDAAMEVNLSFAGTATMNEDYTIEGAEGTGAVRTIRLARGQSEAVFQLVPLSRGANETKTIAIQVLASSFITEAPETPLLLVLREASFVSIHTLRHFNDGTNTTGLVEITRTGDLGPGIEVPLILGGNLANGQDIDPLPPSINLGPGEAGRQLEIRLRHVPDNSNQVNRIEIRLQPDPSHSVYALANPASASILVLPQSAQPVYSYEQWQQLAPANVGNLMAYLTGMNPGPDAGKVSLQVVEGHIELRFTTIAGLTDVTLSVVGSKNLLQWQDITDRFSVSFRWLPEGRVETIYRSIEAVTGIENYYRISARSLPN